MAYCDSCFGTGRTLHHSVCCDDDLCALNGDMHSCRGELAPCHCVLGRRAELSPGLRRCYWLAHPECQRRHIREQAPWRFRWRWRYAAPWAYFRYRSRLRGGRGAERAYRRVLALRGGMQQAADDAMFARLLDVALCRPTEGEACP
jgi:hypothetical protein